MIHKVFAIGLMVVWIAAASAPTLAIQSPTAQLQIANSSVGAVSYSSIDLPRLPPLARFQSQASSAIRIRKSKVLEALPPAMSGSVWECPVEDDDDNRGTRIAVDQTQVQLVSCTVTTSADSGSGSLRQCLLDAASGGLINFSPQVFRPNAPVAIMVLSPLPSITSDGLTLDASNAGVILDGSNLSTGSGLVVSGANAVVIRGLQILDFPSNGIRLTARARNIVIGGDQSLGAGPLGQGNLLSDNRVGIWIDGSGTENNLVLGNYIGTDVTGRLAAGNRLGGVVIDAGASNNVIGGNTPGQRNLVSGNAQDGVHIQLPGTTGNRVVGNYIGTDLTGTQVISNGGYGVLIIAGASNNTIGGPTPGTRNLVSGNRANGVGIERTNTTGNLVQGNYIGTDITGSAPLSNTISGVIIGFGASNNQIGGQSQAERNLISGNGGSGIWLQNLGTTGNQVVGNFIGTDGSGTQPLGNEWTGIYIVAGPTENMIGGNATGMRNLISGNTDVGVWIEGSGTSDNQIVGNYIGTDLSGMSALGNGDIGVFVGFGATNNVIGGSIPSSRNLISGNAEIGIHLQEPGTVGNKVWGNYIGTDATGQGNLGNREIGVSIGFGANHNKVGGDISSRRNIISGNGMAGVALQESGTTYNQVLGNYIGTDPTGMLVVGNGEYGIWIGAGASNNQVGGETQTAGNVISGNQLAGVWFEGNHTTGNQLAGNYIGVDSSGTRALGNGELGVFVGDAASGNIVGSFNRSARNTISGNGVAGVWLQNTDTLSNQVLGNYIGTDAGGTLAVANGQYGVYVGFGASSNTVGGDVTGAGNLISGNSQDGILIQHAETTNNQVIGNYIGTDAGGTNALANGRNGILISGSHDNLIGREGSALVNVISGNAGAGVMFQETTTRNNRILGNRIGTDVTGTSAIGNHRGIVIGFGASANTVGGTVASQRNVISGNMGTGVQLQDALTTGNRIIGNYIGFDASGTTPLPNDGLGVHLLEGSHDNTIGFGNSIAYNASAGVAVEGDITLGNRITRNTIHHNMGLPIDYMGTVVPTGPVFVPDLIDYLPGSHLLTGESCGGCTVEVFANPSTLPASTVFLGATVASGTGAFSLSVPLPPSTPCLSATTTRLDNTTSELSPALCSSPLPVRLHLPMIVDQR